MSGVIHPPRSVSRSLLGLLLALIVAAALWLTQGDSHTPSADPSPATSSGQTSGQTSVVTGLSTIAVSDLPREASETLRVIDDGGPFPYDRDGVTFENREALLPQRAKGYYQEYTVETPGRGDRGARRIVTGSGGELYWTDDQYSSFSRIAR